MKNKSFRRIADVRSERHFRAAPRRGKNAEALLNLSESKVYKRIIESSDKKHTTHSQANEGYYYSRST